MTALGSGIMSLKGEKNKTCVFVFTMLSAVLQQEQKKDIDSGSHQAG